MTLTDRMALMDLYGLRLTPAVRAVPGGAAAVDRDRQTMRQAAKAAALAATVARLDAERVDEPGVCNRCGQERPIHGRGLCHSCNSVLVRERNGVKVVEGTCGNCLRHGRLHARGVCATCYKDKSVRVRFPDGRRKGAG